MKLSSYYSFIEKIQSLLDIAVLSKYMYIVEKRYLVLKRNLDIRFFVKMLGIKVFV